MKSVKKNFIYESIYEVLILLLPLITSPYVSRVLGASGVGVYSYTYTVANYFVLFAALGLKNYGNREISQHRDNQEDLNRTFTSILLLHFIVSGIVLICYLIYCLFFNRDYQVYNFIQGLYVVAAFLDISWFFFGMEEFRITVLRNSVIKIATVVAIFAFVNSADDLWVYILILALGNFLGQAYLWLYIFKYVKPCKVKLTEITRHFVPLVILFIPTIAISLYNYMDKIMVGSIAGETQLGLYENSEKILSIATSIVGSLGTVMMPRMSNLAVKGDVEGQRKIIETSMRFVAWISCAMAFGVMGISAVFPTVFWGDEFSRCTYLILGLAVVIPVKGYANVLRTQFLIPNRMDKQYTISVILGAIFNFTVNMMLIGKMGAMGAVVGTVIAELSVCIVQAIYCHGSLPIFRYIRNSIPYIVIGLVMGLCVYITGYKLGINVPSLVIQVCVGGGIYVLLSFAYMFVTRDSMLDQILSVVHIKIKRK